MGELVSHCYVLTRKEGVFVHVVPTIFLSKPETNEKREETLLFFKTVFDAKKYIVANCPGLPCVKVAA